jgi:hypothetical protein
VIDVVVEVLLFEVMCKVFEVMCMVSEGLSIQASFEAPHWLTCPILLSNLCLPIPGFTFSSKKKQKKDKNSK